MNYHSYDDNGIVKTKVYRVDPFTKVENVMIINVKPQVVEEWLKGSAPIQRLMPNLTADEREFLITGITPESWEKNVGSDEVEREEVKKPRSSIDLSVLLVNDKCDTGSGDYKCQDCGEYHDTIRDAVFCCHDDRSSEALGETYIAFCPVCGEGYNNPWDAVECCTPNFVEIPLKRGFTEIQELYDLITPLGGMIIGGYARYTCSPNKNPVPASDLDVYCKDMETFEAIKTALKRIASVKRRFETNNAITYITDGDWSHVPDIQLVKPINEGHKVASGTVEEIMDNFDFTVTRAYIKDPKTCIVDKSFVRDEENMFLRIKNIHCPISSTFRFMKYRNKGYSTGAREVLKLFRDWDNRDEEYIKSLGDFLDKNNPTQKEIEEGEALLNID
jgi:hypothetical protein